MCVHLCILAQSPLVLSSFAGLRLLASSQGRRWRERRKGQRREGPAEAAADPHPQIRGARGARVCVLEEDHRLSAEASGEPFRVNAAVRL